MPKLCIRLRAHSPLNAPKLIELVVPTSLPMALVYAVRRYYDDAQATVWAIPSITAVVVMLWKTRSDAAQVDPCRQRLGILSRSLYRSTK